MSVKTNLGRVGLVPRGEYDSESSYRRLDFVVFEGSSYVALKDTQGVEPSMEHVPPAQDAVWQPLAEKGARGEDGERGADGVPGKDGAPGKDGRDGKDYVILGPVYSTEEALRQAVTNPNEGDRYEVGTQPPYDVYRCTGKEPPNDWVNDGPLTGGGGEGTVKSVCGVEPGENGDVPLTAEKVGALYPDPDDAGEMGDPVPINADLLEGKNLDEIFSGVQGLCASNPNLLDNWYFPSSRVINQRSVSGKISDMGYFIDRWKLIDGTVELTESGLLLDGTISQILEDDPVEKVTASALTTDGVIDASYDSANKTVSVTATRQTVIAAKLELGDRQTLGLPDSSGNWVLNNPPPDKTLELLKCQRYTKVIARGMYAGAIQGSNTEFIFFIPLSVPLRILPGNFSGKCNVHSATGAYSSVGFTTKSIEMSMDGLIVVATSDKALANTYAMVNIRLLTTITLDANL